MHKDIIWDDDDGRPAKNTLLAPAVAPREIPNTPPGPEQQTVTFWDIFTWEKCSGKVLRAITSREHQNTHLGHLPAVTLYLVAFESAARPDDLAVVHPSLIVRPPKPHP